MKSESQTRSERVDFRVSAEFKALFSRAAEISGVNMSAFIIEAARERAVRLIEQHERMLLGNADRNVLLNALANPPAPAEPLKNAAAKYRTV
jgi:uncharacterized protein (DUF1778 family)